MYRTRRQSFAPCLESSPAQHTVPKYHFLELGSDSRCISNPPSLSALPLIHMVNRSIGHEGWTSHKTCNFAKPSQEKFFSLDTVVTPDM